VICGVLGYLSAVKLVLDIHLARTALVTAWFVRRKEGQAESFRASSVFRNPRLLFSSRLERVVRLGFKALLEEFNETGSVDCQTVDFIWHFFYLV
jgi:hypothetical protein